MANPFKFRELGPDAPFCNRLEEKQKLVSYAESETNAVIFSPRRFGKTSLVRRVRAGEPCTSLFSSSFISKTNLPLGTVQHAKRALQARDLIERDEKGLWKVVDPVFARWLSAL